MKANITNISDIDVTGVVSVDFDILDDDETVLYPMLNVSGDPEQIKSLIAERAHFYERQERAARKLTIGIVQL